VLVGFGLRLVNIRANVLTETDSSLDATRRGAIEGLLMGAGVPYQLTLYGGTSHGFGVRANISDPEQKFGKESAFLQAVRWFESWA
jgi:dienelactone hydrolase